MRNFDFKRYTPGPKKLLRASLIAVVAESVLEKDHLIIERTLAAFLLRISLA